MPYQEPERSDRFSLAGNYKSVTDWARSVPLEQALERELDKLSPIFEGLIEYTEGHQPACSEDCSVELQDIVASGDYKMITLPELQNAYSKLALSQNTLIICDMPITSREVVVEAAKFSVNSDTENAKKYSGKQDSFDPNMTEIPDNDGWCFHQIYREKMDDRLSLAVLGLKNPYDIDNVLKGDWRLMADLENIGRLTNHDWLHQFGPFGIGDTIYYPDKPIKPLHLDCHHTLFNLVPKLQSDQLGVWHYEALVMKVHKDVLATDAASSVQKSIEKSLESFTSSLAEHFRKVATQKQKRTTEYLALQQVAYTMTRFLRRIEPAYGSLTQKFMKDVFNMRPRSTLAKDAQNIIWKLDDGKAGSDLSQATMNLYARYSNSIIFSEIHKESEFSKSAPNHAASLVAALKAHELT